MSTITFTADDIGTPAPKQAAGKVTFKADDIESAPAAAPKNAPGSVAATAEARLRARGTSGAEVKRKAASPLASRWFGGLFTPEIAPENPTPYEREAANVAAFMGGAAELAEAVPLGTVEAMYNIVTAIPKGLKYKFGVGPKPEPERRLSQHASEVGAEAERQVRAWLGVRPNVDVPSAVVMKQVPGLIATVEGIRAMARGGARNTERSAPEEAAVENPAAPVPEKPVMPAENASDFNQAVRLISVGERDVRVAQAAGLADVIEHEMPKVSEQEAVTVMRDFKSNPDAAQQFLDGTHPFYDDIAARARAYAEEAIRGKGGKPAAYMRTVQEFLDDVKKSADPADEIRAFGWKARDAAVARVRAMQPTIEQAMAPTEAMKRADAAMNGYYAKTLQEAKELDILKEKYTDATTGEEHVAEYDSEAYVPHLLEPKNPRPVVATAGGRLRYARMSRFTPFAKQRGYETVLHAIADGVEPRTLNSLDALRIYGDRHGTAVGTRTLVNVLKESSMAKWLSDPTKAPEGWVDIAPESRVFKNEFPIVDKEGAPHIVRQSLFVPEKIARAIKPLVDADASHNIRGFTAARAYQAYLKSVELSLSVFHMRALNLTAQGNMGVAGLMKSYAADMRSPTFLAVEQDFIRHGGTTPITGKVTEAYRAARGTGALPTRLDVLRNAPVFKQLDRAAAATSRLTFDVLQRKFKVTDFGIKDAAWIAEHPNATPRQLAAARRSIAAEINAAYGGLNWEALGINKLEHSFLKAIFLAPDWTFSNWFNATTVFKGGPGGAAARMFWFRSAMTGVILSQFTSVLLSGKAPAKTRPSGDWVTDYTQVYFGQDHKGKSVHQNVFFAGAPSDLITLMSNVHDYGPGIGVAHSVGNKLAPFLREAEQMQTNKDFLGRDIAVKGAPLWWNTQRQAKNAVANVLPVPFSATNIAQMVTDKKTEYSPEEYLAVLTAATRPRHLPPKAVRDMWMKKAMRKAQRQEK